MTGSSIKSKCGTCGQALPYSDEPHPDKADGVRLIRLADESWHYTQLHRGPADYAGRPLIEHLRWFHEVKGREMSKQYGPHKVGLATFLPLLTEKGFASWGANYLVPYEGEESLISGRDVRVLTILGGQSTNGQLGITNISRNTIIASSVVFLTGKAS